MPDEADNQSSDRSTPDFQANTSDPDSQRELRERVTRLAFGGDPKRVSRMRAPTISSISRP